MLFLKASLVFATAWFFMDAGCAPASGGNAAETRREETAAKQQTQASPEPQTTMDSKNSEMNVMAEGSHSEVISPFLAVAREPGTYAALRKLVPSLPHLLDDFFKSRTVVAAFMGERNTGGYSVEIARTADRTMRITANSPGKDAMVTQVMTAPFKVVSFPNTPSLAVESDELWRQAMRTYALTAAGFSMSGGFAGRREEFGLDGEIRVMREGKLATFIFDLQSRDGEKQRSLKETASGVVEGGQTTIYVMGAGSLIEVPHGNLTATGTFGDKKKALTMTFKSLPTMIADGYSGEGFLEAEVGTPAAKSNTKVDKKP